MMRTTGGRTARRAATVLLAAAAAAGCTGQRPAGPPSASNAAAAPAGRLGTPSIPPATHPPQPLPSGKPGTPAGAPGGLPSVNWDNPSSVSAAAITVMYTMDTAIDTSQYQAELRAARYLTPSYRAQVKAAAPVGAPGVQWDTWAAHRAYTTVKLAAEHTDQPQDTPTAAYRQWAVTAIPHGRDHWLGTPLTATVFATLSRTGGRWLVSAISVSS